MMELTGIYYLENTINGKRYWGSTEDSFKSRKGRHLTELRHNKHGNNHLQRSWNKYGEKTFEFNVYLVCEKEFAREYEQFVLDNLTKWGFDYNLHKSAIGWSSENNPNKGKDMSGDKHPRWGMKNSAEHRKKIGDGNRGKTISEEVKKKQSILMSGSGNPMYGIPSPMTGKHHTSKARKKMVDSQTGNRNSFYGKTHTDAYKAEISKRTSGENNPRCKVSDEQVWEIRELYDEGIFNGVELSLIYKIDNGGIYKYINNREIRCSPLSL